jgi:hypothetical protein
MKYNGNVDANDVALLLTCEAGGSVVAQLLVSWYTNLSSPFSGHYICR